MPPPPPRSPPFPSTTLFRSWPGGRAARPPDARGDAVDHALDAIGVSRRSDADGRAEPGLHREEGAGRRARIASVRDRKSTRLNSSHMSISYAVFCLKKKKKQ